MRVHRMVGFLVLVGSSGWGWAADPDWPDPRELVRLSDERMRREYSETRLTMDIQRPEWSRSMVLQAWTEGVSNAFIRVLEPARERGVTFLKKGREAWQYIPSVDRTIKLPPSMMLQSWLGSDFTNDDVVRADSIVVDYRHEMVGAEDLDGLAGWHIRAIPLEDAAVVWGKVELHLRQDNLVPVRIEYYDEDGECVKVLMGSDVREVDGLEVAMSYRMEDRTKPGHLTRLHYEDLSFPDHLEPELFSTRNLRR